jgi:hypothetical protein
VPNHSLHQRRFAGVAPQVHPTAVPVDMAASAVDCQLGNGMLRPWRTDAQVPGVLPDLTAGTLFIEDCCVMREPCTASVVRVPIGCDAVMATGILDAGRTATIPYPVQAPLAQACEGNWTRLGLPCPPGALDVAWLDQRQTEQRVTARSFLFTWENWLGQESTASVPSAVTVQDFDDRAVLSGWTWPSAEYRVTHLHIYELRAGIANANAKGSPGEGAFFRVATVTPGTLSLLFNPATAAIGPMYDGDLFQAPPADLHDLQHWDTTQLAGISGSYVYFSEPGFVHAWPDRYRVECFSPPIRFIAGQQWGYLLGCEAPEIINMTLSAQSAAGLRPLHRLREKLPLIALRGVVPWGEGVVYASTSGLVHLHEASATLISSDLWSRTEWEALDPTSMHLAVHEGFLFMTTSKGTVRLKLQGHTWGKVDAFDITYLSIKPQAWYETRAGVLTYLDAGGAWQWNQGSTLKPYRYESRVFVTNGTRGWAVAKVVSDTGEVNLTVRCGAQVLFSGRPPHNKPFRLKKGTTSTQHQFVLEGTAEVTEVHVASGFGELARS